MCEVSFLGNFLDNFFIFRTVHRPIIQPILAEIEDGEFFNFDMGKEQLGSPEDCKEQAKSGFSQMTRRNDFAFTRFFLKWKSYDSGWFLHLIMNPIC